MSVRPQLLLHRPALLVAAALVGVALVAPAAEAASPDAKLIRTAAVRYWQATTNGSPQACRLVTPKGQVILVYAGSALTRTKLDSCPAAVEALAKLNASQFPSRQAYLRSSEATAQAIAQGKVTVRGTRATLDYTVGGIVKMSSSIEFAHVHGHWLIDG